MNRRGFLEVLAGLIAAPAIVRCESLMPVRGFILPKTTLHVVRANSRLIQFRMDVYREYLRENLFAPCTSPQLGEIMRVIDRGTAA